MNKPATWILAVAALGVAITSCSADVSVSKPSSSAPAATSSSEDTATYSGNGVTLDYPATWQRLDQATTGTSTGTAIWNQAFGPGDTEANLAILTAYQLKLDVSNVPADQIKKEIGTTLDQIAQQAGGSRVGELAPASLGSLPGFQATIDAKGPSGQAVQSRVVLAFDHDVEYFLNCQYESSAQADILAGCDTIEQSFSTS